MISVPAVFNFGDDHMRNTIGRELLLGNKNSALAISEPFAGSDVAGIKTTAVKTADGKHYIVNGVKKWITEGMFSDYFITAVKTGDGKGAGGMSMLVIPRVEGVETRQIKTTYSTCAGTSLVIFQDVLVPVANLLGKEHQGFKLVMYNFNHERWAIVQSLLGQARAAITDTFLWANQRKVFGKALIQQPVIRNKLAGAIAALEAVQSYSENLTYTMCNAKDGPLGSALAGYGSRRAGAPTARVRCARGRLWPGAHLRRAAAGAWPSVLTARRSSSSCAASALLQLPVSGSVCARTRARVCVFVLPWVGGRRPIALLKYQATRTGWRIADDTVQIFGGKHRSCRSLSSAWARCPAPVRGVRVRRVWGVGVVYLLACAHRWCSTTTGLRTGWFTSRALFRVAAPALHAALAACRARDHQLWHGGQGGGVQELRKVWRRLRRLGRDHGRPCHQAGAPQLPAERQAVTVVAHHASKGLQCWSSLARRPRAWEEEEEKGILNSFIMKILLPEVDRTYYL